MALVKVDLFSKSLMRTVTINAIIPVDKLELTSTPREKNPFKTLYLLHGIFGNYTDWVSGTRIQTWAQEQNLAVIMPSGDNKFYLDNESSGELYGTFIGEELVEMTRALFPLSTKREDTFIAGLSMGGYGAIINGLQYPQTFSHIAGLSSALILDTVVKVGEETSNLPIQNRQYYQHVFGNLDTLVGSDKDYRALIIKLQKEGKEIPNLYLACGSEDMLVKENRAYRDFLINQGIEVTYQEGPGGHDWVFWDRYIYKVLQWLPLEKKTESIHSGNVK